MFDWWTIEISVAVIAVIGTVGGALAGAIIRLEMTLADVKRSVTTLLESGRKSATNAQQLGLKKNARNKSKSKHWPQLLRQKKRGGASKNNDSMIRKLPRLPVGS